MATSTIGLAQVAQHAEDLDRATAFYTLLLGAEPAAVFDPPGLVFFTLGPTRLLLEVGAPSATLYLRVDDVHAEVDRLRTAGVTIESEPHVIFSHTDDTLGPAGQDEWQAFLRDSEGNLVGLVSHTPAATVFALLTDPSRHHEFDDTEMVGLPVEPRPLTAVGQVFTMAMTWRSGDHVEYYRSDNHLVALDPDRTVAWATALPGGPPLGWTWRYDLEPTHGGDTRVTLSYDWTDTPPEHVDRFGVPVTDAAGLAASLDRLCRAVNG